jgi:serine/threonine protein kinase
MGIALRKYFKDLADYNEIRLLGAGGCGQVFLCEEKETGVLVAIKKVNDIAEPRNQRSFIREIIVPLKLNLPGIVQLVGFRFPEPPTTDSEGQPALIITELMPNGALDKILKLKHSGQPTPGFGPTEFSKAVFGIAATMAQVHKHGAIHRDLKPANVFLDERWEVRIADFGLAKIVTNGVKMTMAIGSPMYMAPELILGDETYTVGVDVYAYAILLYQFFTDQRVCRVRDKDVAPTSTQMLWRIVTHGDRYKRQDGIPDAFWDLITQCWEHAPAKRLSFEEIVEHMLKSDDYTFPGTDLAAYHEYRERMKPQEDDPAPGEIKLSQSQGGGLKVSRLASSNQLLADERKKAVQKSVSFGQVGEESDADQALRRYDFTRSSLRRA